MDSSSSLDTAGTPTELTVAVGAWTTSTKEKKKKNDKLKRIEMSCLS